MANSDSSPRGAGQLTSPRHLVTHDEERIEHIISDETLMQLVRGGSDMSLQIAIGAFGIAAGYAQNMVAVIAAITADKPIGGWNGFGAAAFLLAFAVFIYASFLHRNNHTSMSDLVRNIRSRKLGLMAVPENPYEGGAPFAGDPAIPANVSVTTD